MSEFSINGNTYRSIKMDALKQWHVFRRLSPVIVQSLTPELIKAIQDTKNDGDPLRLFEPFVQALGGMSDADTEYVIHTCLSVVQRQQGHAWAPVSVNNSLMFQDLDLMTLGRIVFQVITDNLSNFFSASPQG